jgi:hypothetical protein
MTLVRIRLRRGGKNEWETTNPTLEEGEVGIETGSTYLKIGDGLNEWNNLSYAKSFSADNIKVTSGSIGENKEFNLLYVDAGTLVGGSGPVRVRTESSAGPVGPLTYNPSTNIITAQGFSGSVAGNATSATRWQSDRTLTIGNSGKTVNGTGNINWSLSEIGAAATDQTMHIGTTTVQINRNSANQGLTGISSLAMPGSTSGTIIVQPAAIAGTTTVTIPNVTGTLITTGDTGTVTNTMLAGSILNSKLVNSTISGVALGSNLFTLTLNTLGLGISGNATYNGSSAATFTISSNASSSAASNALVVRDASGNFSASAIFATLNGNASSSTVLATTRTIWGQNFNGSQNVTGDLTGVGAISGSAALTLVATGNNNIIATTNGLERVRVTGTGQVNIGGNFTSTNNLLHVSGAASIGYSDAAPTNGLLVSGSMGIGVTNPATKLHVNGAISSTGDITAFVSDERLKTKIGKIENSLDIITNLNPFSYKINNLGKSYGIGDNKLRYGLSAQEVQSLLPEITNIAPFDQTLNEEGEIVSKSGENYLTLDYAKLVPILIQAIKDLRAELHSYISNDISK